MARRSAALAVFPTDPPAELPEPERRNPEPYPRRHRTPALLGYASGYAHNNLSLVCLLDRERGRPASGCFEAGELPVVERRIGVHRGSPSKDGDATSPNNTPHCRRATSAPQIAEAIGAPVRP